MKKIFPEKLKKGDEVRVVAPVRSLATISEENRNIADRRFKKLGLKLSFGKNVEDVDDFVSSSIEKRVEDLHDAFSNPKVNAILTVIGGYNSNQLLRHLDWDLIKKHPKILCGFSDVTALNNSFFAKTGLVTYSGPHYSTFGQELHFNYTLDYFKKCLMSTRHYEILPSDNWSDDLWFKDQKDRKLMMNTGWLVINEGEVEGTIVGGNLCTLNLLQGTEYLPRLENTILFLEDDEESQPHHFDRDLQSLIHLPGFKGVKGIVIGRFQKASQMSNQKLEKIIKTKKELSNLPVLANVEFGHSDPKITYPIGGTVKFKMSPQSMELKILAH